MKNISSSSSFPEKFFLLELRPNCGSRLSPKADQNKRDKKDLPVPSDCSKIEKKKMCCALPATPNLPLRSAQLDKSKHTILLREKNSVKLMASLAKNIQQVERNKETSRHATNAIMCATPPHTHRITERERERERERARCKTKQNAQNCNSDKRTKAVVDPRKRTKDGPQLPSSLFFFSASFSASSSVPREAFTIE
jgi:hypothetical protein